MHEIILQSKSPCWHTSGWNEKSKQRKKRKKRDKLLNTNRSFNSIQESKCSKSLHQDRSLNTLSRMKIISLILMPIMFMNILSIHLGINILFANGQIVVEHPKSYAKLSTQVNSLSPPLYNNNMSSYQQSTNKTKVFITKLDENRPPADFEDLLSSDNITNYSTLPSSREKQHEMLRKLSSTMLLDTLLRHPAPTNRAPFPPLFMLSSIGNSFESNGSKRFHDDSPSQVRKLISTHNNTARPSGSRKGIKQPHLVTNMDVSTTNRTVVTDKNYPSGEVPNLMPSEIDSAKQDNFSASSLNYLVDKLLSAQPFKQDILRKRPSQRKSPYEDLAEIAPTENAQDQNSNPEINLNNSPITLDVLIRDEYNSRVQPMLKSMLDQRKLSSSSSSRRGNTTPYNHKLDANAFDNDISATTSPFNVDRRKPPKEINQSTTPESSGPIIAIERGNQSSIIAVEELDDIEDDEDFDDELEDNVDINLESDKNSTKKISKNKTKSANTNNDRKILQNVPPYQLSNTIGLQANGINNPPVGLNSSQSKIQATTMSSIDQSLARNKKKTSNSGEKITDASHRDSLVFSDGADEDRASKRRIQSDLTKINPDPESSSGSNHKRRKDSGGKVKNSGGDRPRDRVTDSFLLDLFSTMSPLTDLEKLKETYISKDSNDQNPLIYKGYVGKDDYLLSSTARDWSRPLNNRDSTAPQILYKYLSNNQQPAGTAPTIPPSDVTTNSYYPNQPVTNAQSVPTMVIPTSDQPEMTTPQPLTSGFEPSRRKIAAALLPNSQLGSNSNFPGHQHQGINTLLQNSSSHRPIGGSQTYSNADRKYSYQIPDKLLNRTRQHQVNSQSSSSANDFKPLLNDTSEGSGGYNVSKSLLSSSKLTSIVELDRNWSPSKIIQNSQQDHPKRYRAQAQNNMDNNTLMQPLSVNGSPMNLSSPIIVPFVGMKNFSTTPVMNTMIQTQGKILPTDISMNGIETISAGTSPPTIRPVETTAKPMSEISGLGDVGGHSERHSKKNFTHTDKRSNNFQRNKVKLPKKETSQETTSVTNPIDTDSLLGDTDSEQDDEDNRSSSQKKNKKPSRHKNHHEKHDRDESDSLDDYQSESDENSDDQVATTTYRPKNNNKKQSKDRTRTSVIEQQQNMNEQVSEDSRQNQTKKANLYSTKHDTAGSEISMVGLDKNLSPSPVLHRRNQTSRFISQKQQPPQVNTETITLSGSEGEGISIKPNTVSISDSSSSSVPTSFGSTIIPNSNYFGETSSDSPTLESSILNGGSSGKMKRLPGHITAADDPYQRISSTNNIVSAVLQPSSKMMVPTVEPKLLQPSTTTEILRKQEDSIGSGSNVISSGSSSGSKSANDPVPTKPSSKGTSDRLAFILICGSCFLSVVCLVLAAMSVRCPDMFDDYRYMRNAERAAIRLQKHRLRYTKNHQINRFNHEHSSPGDVIGSKLIDDLNIQTSNVLPSEPEMNHMRNSTKCLNSRSAQFNQLQGNTTTDTNNIWNPQGNPQSLPALLNKEHQTCRCANCQRWPYQQQEDLMAANKHLSWLHPYFYMQNHSRLRPLFGAGSSVGTFFPRRMDDPKLHTAGGSIDAQILIDNQPPHSCGIPVDQRGVTRAKSILNTNNKKPPSHRHVNGLELSQHDTSNFGCNNPTHNHLHHDCHNHAVVGHHHHLHHTHRCNLDTSTSDDSELTIDDSVHHCDSAKCSAHHQKTPLNNRIKLTQLRATNGQHNHHSSIWKPRSFRKSTQSSNHHHHHHHHQQVSSSDASSIAQCTCSRDLQPLLHARRNSSHRTSHKRLSNKHDTNFKQAKRDKSLGLVWSTNRDRLI